MDGLPLPNRQDAFRRVDLNLSLARLIAPRAGLDHARKVSANSAIASESAARFLVG